jgi:hypothetical protein
LEEVIEAGEEGLRIEVGREEQISSAMVCMLIMKGRRVGEFEVEVGLGLVLVLVLKGGVELSALSRMAWIR